MIKFIVLIRVFQSSIGASHRPLTSLQEKNIRDTFTHSRLFHGFTIHFWMTHAAHTVYFDSGTIISHKAMPSRHKSCSFNRKVLWRNSTTTNGIPPNWLCGLKLWEFGLFKFSNLARCNGFFTFHVSFRRSHQAQRSRFDHRSSSYSFSRRSFIKQRGRKYCISSVAQFSYFYTIFKFIRENSRQYN